MRPYSNVGSVLAQRLVVDLILLQRWAHVAFSPC